MIPARAISTGPPETPAIRTPLRASLRSHAKVARSRKAAGLPAAHTISMSRSSASPTRAVAGTEAPAEEATTRPSVVMLIQRYSVRPAMTFAARNGSTAAA